MKQMKNLWGGEYTAPTLEVLDIAVEQGFAISEQASSIIAPWGDDEDDLIIYCEKPENNEKDFFLDVGCISSDQLLER